MSGESIEERQRRVQQSGQNWEQYVELFLKESLPPHVKVKSGKRINRDSKLGKRLSIPLKSSLRMEEAWGDIDLVAYINSFPIAIISCKLSLHGRFTETLFYSLLFRTISKIKVVLATPDSGRGQKGRWTSEWGTYDSPTKDRLLAESYLDGVYVENVPEFIKDMKPDEKTSLGGIVKPLSDLPKDLTSWAEETSKLHLWKANLTSKQRKLV